MTIDEWLERPWTDPFPWSGEDHRQSKPMLDAPVTTLKVMAALVGMNQSPKVQHWEIFQEGPAPYFRIGLTQPEGLTLISLWNYAGGLIAGASSDPKAQDKQLKRFHDRILHEITRMGALMEMVERSRTGA